MKLIKIVQISDIHCGTGNTFNPSLMEKTIEQVNKYSPDIMVITGDLTTDGYFEEYKMAVGYIKQFKVSNKIIVPGNHDSRNVGYRTFEKLIGPLSKTLKIDNDILVCGADSTEPDLDDGQIGRGDNAKLKKVFSENFNFKILALHHHVISVPNCGREMNILRDAGNVLKMAVQTGVNLILSGHKHVPNLWLFERIKILNCSTTTSNRLRGIYKPSYNIIEIGKELKITKQEVEGISKIIYKGSY